MNRIAVDIGGTFTDCLVVWEGQVIESKALTTHFNLALGFNEAIKLACHELGIDSGHLYEKVDSIRYATTLGTNAMIERDGPKLGLLVTHGFEGTVAVSRGRGYGEGLDREEIRDLSNADRPEPLVPLSLTRGVKERINHTGDVLYSINENDLRAQVRDLVDEGVQVLVVCLAHATSNPVHELRVQEIIREEYPSHLLGSIPVILSHQVSGRKGEYVRASSTILDAYLHGIMYHAMSDLEVNLNEQGYEKPMLLVHNTGGMAQLNSTDALKTVHSGPVAGINASEQLSLQSKLGNIVATDMGGTSFDIGIIVEGGYKHYDFTPVIDRWLVTTPMVHLVTLGSGGGSTATYDQVYNTIKVGPKSAGSQPGPACYNRGGLNPTVTDSDLLLGYLDAEKYAGGKIPLRRVRSLMATEDIADDLEISELEVAKLIKEIADRDMATGMLKELRSMGYVPEDFTMLAYGGNGPLHACGIAGKAGIDKVLVPPYSSVFSAAGGASLTPLHFHEHSRMIALCNMQKVGTKPKKMVFWSDFEALNEIIEDLEQRGRDELERQGIELSKVKHRLELDCRYGSQKMESAIVLEKNRIENMRDLLGIAEKLSVNFEKRFGKGTPAPESGLWIVNFRVATFIEDEPIALGDVIPPEEKLPAPSPVGSRKCHFLGVDDEIETPVFDGAALQAGVVIEGPALVNPGQTTYLVEPGWRMESAANGAVWFLKNNSSVEG
jgi:N-methylhydantoinase A